MTDAWMLDELAHAGPEHLDEAFVAAYERKAGYVADDGRAAEAGAEVADDVDVLRAHGLDPTATVVDLGAGTGRFALAAAPHCRRVIAVDVSDAMLDALRARAAVAGVDNLTCVRAGFLTYTHNGPPADVVHTRHALHQLPDFWKGVALHRIAGLLRPGGVLRVRDLIYDVPLAGVSDLMTAWLAGAGDDPTRGYTAADLAEHLRTEHSTYRWLFEPLLDAAGFDIVAVAFRRQLYGAYTCIRR